MLIIAKNIQVNEGLSMRMRQQVPLIRVSDMRDAQQMMDIDALVWNDCTAPEPMNWTSREDFLRHCEPGSQLVAVVNDRLCGYVGFRCPTGISGNRHVLEINIAVHPDAQHQGIGKRLMHAMKERAVMDGVTKLRLRVLSTNPSAIAFYERCGFVQEGRLVKEFFVGGRFVDDILMAYYL